MNALYSFFSAFHGTEVKTTNKSKICFPFFILYDEEILNDLKCLNFNARYLRILNQNLWKSAFRGCALSSMTSIRKKPECIRVRSNSKQTKTCLSRCGTIKTPQCSNMTTFYRSTGSDDFSFKRVKYFGQYVKHHLMYMYRNHLSELSISLNYQRIVSHEFKQIPFDHLTSSVWWQKCASKIEIGSFSGEFW